MQNSAKNIMAKVTSYAFVVILTFPFVFIYDTYNCTKPFSIAKEIQNIEIQYEKPKFWGYTCGKPDSFKTALPLLYKAKIWIQEETQKWH